MSLTGLEQIMSLNFVDYDLPSLLIKNEKKTHALSLSLSLSLSLLLRQSPLSFLEALLHSRSHPILLVFFPCYKYPLSKHGSHSFLLVGGLSSIIH